MDSVDRLDALAEFPARFTVPVQWGDQDAFGHINNVVYIRWFESARIAYLEQSGLDPLLLQHGLGPILANVSCNYRRQLLYPDTVTIGARITRLGRTSLTMRHAVLSHAQQAIVADGDSIVVTFNYKTQQSVEIPQDVREAIARFEGAGSPGEGAAG
jgi:acyl-CoA thioester hydrolase